MNSLASESTPVLRRFFDLPVQPLIRQVQKAYEALEAQGRSLPGFRLTLPHEGGSFTFGRQKPCFTLEAHDRAGLAALTSFDETRFCAAVMAGAIDIEGDFLALFRLRPILSDHHPLRALWYKTLHPIFFGQVRSDEQWIAQHYDEDPDFFGLFLDRRRCYSHGLFLNENDSLDEAIERKLAFALQATGAESAQRVLDIGAGWGAMTEYAGRRGMQVTSLTISETSRRFVAQLIDDQGLPCRVIKEHFLRFRAEQSFDAIVNLGVTEHLPDYRATLEQYFRLLEPGGRVYLDACASRTKFSFSSFIYRHVFPGNATPLCLHEYLSEVAKTRFEVIAIYNDRQSYELTCRRWAENLERHRTEIVERWGNSLFRRFQIYLWGCVDVFSRDACGAFRLILQKP